MHLKTGKVVEAVPDNITGCSFFTQLNTTYTSLFSKGLTGPVHHIMPILALKAVKNWKEKSRHKDEDEDRQEKDAVTILKPPEPKYKFIISRDKAPRSNCLTPWTNAEANNLN